MENVQFFYDKTKAMASKGHCNAPITVKMANPFADQVKPSFQATRAYSLLFSNFSRRLLRFSMSSLVATCSSANRLFNCSRMSCFSCACSASPFSINRLTSSLDSLAEIFPFFY